MAKINPSSAASNARRLDVYEYVVFCRILQIDPAEILRPIYDRVEIDGD